MKLSYFELLSPEPIQMPDIGHVICPTLRDVSSLGHLNYLQCLNILTMEPRTLFSSTEGRAILQTVLNFFIKENVVSLPDHPVLFVKDKDTNVGTITLDNYPELCNVICQRIKHSAAMREDASKVKSKKAAEIMQKLENGRKKTAKQTKTDENMELANIISAVANKSPSLNMINIWDLTIFQLWDCFQRLLNNNIYDMQAMAAVTWGSKDDHFDANAWCKKL